MLQDTCEVTAKDEVEWESRTYRSQTFASELLFIQRHFAVAVLNCIWGGKTGAGRYMNPAWCI